MSDAVTVAGVAVGKVATRQAKAAPTPVTAKADATSLVVKSRAKAETAAETAVAVESARIGATAKAQERSASLQFQLTPEL